MGSAVTASQSARLLQCSWSFDKETEGGEGSKGESTRFGSAFHQVMARLLCNLPEDRVLEECRAACERYTVPTLADELHSHVLKAHAALIAWLSGNNPWGLDWHRAERTVEKSYYLDVDTGWAGPCTLIEEDGGHEYVGAPEGTIPGTVDLFCKGDLKLVLDHKTGSAEDYSNPGENAQLLTLALMTDARVVAVLHAPRGGSPIIYADEVNDEILEKHQSALQMAVARIGDGSMRPGHECRYCPARDICPAKQGELLSKASEVVTAAGQAIVVARKTGEITLDKRGELDMVAEQAEKLIKAIRAENRKFVEENPGLVVKRPDGKALQLVKVEVERLSKKKLGEERLKELRAAGILEKSVEYHLKRVTGDD